MECHNTENHKCSCGNQNGFDFTELDLFLEKVAGLPGNLIMILQQAQNIYGYLPREVIAYISARPETRRPRYMGWRPFTPSSGCSQSERTSSCCARERLAM